MALVDDVQASLQPFMEGQPGFSPMTASAVNAFTQNTLPVIPNQLQLQGLGSSPAVADVAGRSLGTALPQFIQGDLSNRLQATQQMAGVGQNILLPAWQTQLQGLQSAGEINRGMSQDIFDSAREEMLRQQGLSESGTTGVFGQYQPITKTESSGSK